MGGSREADDRDWGVRLLVELRVAGVLESLVFMLGAPMFCFRLIKVV